MKRIYIVLFISLLLAGCSLKNSDKNDRYINQDSETINYPSEDQADRNEGNNKETPSPAFVDNEMTASKEPVMMTMKGITFKLPGTWNDDNYVIYAEDISIWFNYSGEKDIPLFFLTVEGPEGTEVEELGLMSDIRTIDGWVFSINYSYEINYSNQEEVLTECPHEFFTMGDYLQELIASIKVTDESQLKAWYNEYHAEHLAVNSFDEAVNIVKADISPVEEDYFYYSDETPEGEAGIYTVAVRRQKDTVIGAWFEINKSSGLLRNTGGGSDLAPTEAELNVWHFPNETFVANGKRVYYIDQEYPTSINCRTCDYIGNIISDEIFSGTPHMFVTLEMVGDFLYTIDIGYMEIFKIDMATGHKESLLPVNIIFRQNFDVYSFVLDNNIIEYCLTVPEDIDNGYDSYSLIYDYDTSSNQFIFKGKFNNNRTYGKINLNWVFEYHEDPTGDMNKSYTDVSIRIDDETKYIGSVVANAIEGPIGQYPENTIMSCRGFFGENSSIHMELLRNELIVFTNDVIEYSEGDIYEEPEYKEVMRIDIDPAYDILVDKSVYYPETIPDSY